MSSEFTANQSNLASRRRFLEFGLGACAAGTVIRPLWGEPLAVSYYKVVFDERFEDARAFGAGAAERGIPAAAIRGDVTSLFFDDLDLRWKQGPVRLAGYTTPASLFCLDLLARDRGMRVSHCAAKPGVERALGVLDGVLPPGCLTAHLSSGDSSDPVFWIIRPSASANLPDHAFSGLG